MASPDPWRNVTEDARRAADLAREETARSGLYAASATGQAMPDPDRAWSKAGLWLLVLVWCIAATQSLTVAVAGIEAIVALALLKDWFGIRQRMPLINSENRWVAATGTVLLVLLGIVALLVASG